MRFKFRYWMLLGMMACMVSLRVKAEQSMTEDGRSFHNLKQSEVVALSEAEQLAYAEWLKERSPAAPASEGPNTMDMSSDFSM